MDRTVKYHCQTQSIRYHHFFGKRSLLQFFQHPQWDMTAASQFGKGYTSLHPTSLYIADK